MDLQREICKETLEQRFIFQFSVDNIVRAKISSHEMAEIRLSEKDHSIAGRLFTLSLIAGFIERTKKLEGEK